MSTLNKIRAEIARHEAALTELRSAEEVVSRFEGGTAPPPENSRRPTITEAIMAALKNGAKPAKDVLASVNSIRGETPAGSVYTALQELKKQGKVVLRGKEWRPKS